MHKEAELRQQRIAEKEKRKAEWEARQAEREKKKAVLRAAAGFKATTPSTCSSETLSTFAPSTVSADYEAAKRMAGEDREVRKLEKLLRDIQKLEDVDKVDKLQQLKLARKVQVLIDLDTARGLAESRARDVLRKRAEACAISQLW